MTPLALKEAVRARDGYRCTRCGMANQEHVALHGRQLEVHRKVPGSLYALDDTCTTLCRACHGPQPRRKRGSLDLANGCCLRVRGALYVRLETVARALGLPVGSFLCMMIREHLYEYEQRAQDIRRKEGGGKG